MEIFTSTQTIVILAGEPGVAKVFNITYSYSRRLPALGIKSWFQLKCPME